MPASDLELTIDARSGATEEVLAGVGEVYSPKGATAIVMDPNNGDIWRWRTGPGRRQRGRRGAGWARINRAVGFTYEPGSTFKSIPCGGARVGSGSFARARCSRWAPDQGRRPDDHRGARRRAACARCPTSWPALRTSARSRSASRLGGKRFDSWVRALRLRRPDRACLCRGVGGDRAALRGLLGSSIGNLPTRAGTRGDPDADDARVLRGRERRQAAWSRAS